MTATLILPDVFAGATGPVADLSGVANLPEAEAGAWGHWIFDKGDADSLVGLVNNRNLSLQGAAPTYAATSLTVGDYQKALLTGLADRLDYTVAVVVEYDTGNQVIAGALSATESGALISNGDTKPYSSFVRGPSTVGLGNVPDTAPTEGDFVFVAHAIDHTTSTRTRTLFASGESQDFDTDDAAMTPSSSDIAFGNGYWSTYTNEVTLAEAMVFDSALTASEMAAIYLRSKARMARRSISI